MPHFLIKTENIKNNFVELVNDENFFHIVKVLRVKTGEIIKFINENKTVYEAKTVQITKNSLKAEILNSYQSKRYLKNDIVLVQSILMNDAQNLLIANATQTGIKEIFPVISDNVSVPLKTLKNKKEKWEKIALENFKQCERADLVKINEISNLDEVLNTFKKQNTLIFAEKYENHTLDTAIKDIDLKSKIAVVVGPEGGFSQKEFDYFKKENFKLITLGTMIYKAPNAVVSAISNVVSRIEK